MEGKLQPLSVSGVLFSTQQIVMREMVGDAAYERALAKLPANVREAALTTAAIGWVPFTIVEPVVTAVALEAGRTVENFQRDLVRKLTERTVRGIWRVLVRFSSPEAIMSRTSTIWNRMYNCGTATLEVPRDGRGELVVRGLPNDAPDFMLRGLAYSMEALIEHLRNREARVVWRRTPDGAVYSVTTRPR